jgi:hypothetical protein
MRYPDARVMFDYEPDTNRFTWDGPGLHDAGFRRDKRGCWHLVSWRHDSYWGAIEALRCDDTGLRRFSRADHQFHDWWCPGHRWPSILLHLFAERGPVQIDDRRVEQL